MSFQAYLDKAEQQTGVTPQQFLDLAAEKELAQPAKVLAWLKADYQLGHGHASALARLIDKGPAFVAERYGTDGVIRLDGLAAR